MTTAATIEQPATQTPDPQATPASIDLTSVFYGPVPPTESVSSEQTGDPAPTPETGPSATPKASADSAGEAKPGNQPKGTAETKEEKKEEGGHAAAARRLGNEVKELKAELSKRDADIAELKAKIDGTYQKPKDPTPEEIAAQAEFRGREQASRSLAEEKYGVETVREEVYSPGSAYEQLVKQAPWVQLEVMRDKQPAMAAMRVLARHRFMEKYGDDPSVWVEKIVAELKPTLLEEFKQQTTKPVTGSTPPSVTGSRGSGGPERERSLVDLFYSVSGT